MACAVEVILEVPENCVELESERVKKAAMATDLAAVGGVQQLQHRYPPATSNLQPGMIDITNVSMEAKGVLEFIKTCRVTEINIPEYYIQPENLRQQSADLAPTDSSLNVDPMHHIPVIDLSTSSREDLVKAIGKACEVGFFHVVNHGTPLDLLLRMAEAADEFFAMPVEEKLRWSTSAKKEGPIHFGGGSRGDWRDVLRITYAPASEAAMDRWPLQPAGFTETLTEYTIQQAALSRTLLEIISESLGLEKNYIDTECGDPRFIYGINHYPPCPNPTLTMGVREHSDPSTITTLLQPGNVSGLQVQCKDGLWIDVKPVKDAIVVNVGDHLQLLSNGRYSSCLHRVLNNKWKPRTSVAFFFAPHIDTVVKPAPALIDEAHPARYREFVYRELLRKASYFYHLAGRPNKRAGLCTFQISSEPIP